MFDDRIAELYENLDRLRTDVHYRTSKIEFLEQLLQINPRRKDDITKAIEVNTTRIRLDNVGIQGCLDDITTLTIKELEQVGVDSL